MASGKYDYLHKKNGYGKVKEVEYGDTMETVSASSDAPSANSYKPRQTKIRTSALDAAHLRNDRSRLKSEIGKIQNTLVSGELYKNGANKAAADRDYHNKYNRMKSLEKELAKIDTKLKSYEYDEYLDDTHKNNFGGRFEANLAQGRLSQDSSAAWNKYLSNPTEENRQLAEHIDYVAEQFGANNKKVLAEDGLISKSLANYLPQLKDQTKAQIIGGLGGAAAGAGVALGAGLLAPTPEEVVTVPTLAVKGLKTGITAASGLYSYGNMRGAAFRELISSGVDEETARAAASDEALISGLIEMADTGIDLATLGIGKLINNVGKFGLKQTAKQVAKEGTEAATEKSIKKVVSALGKYGLNIAQEAAEEGSQEIVSIANQQRALEGNTGKADLLLNSIRKGFNLNAAEKAQVLESAAEGAKIASMLGGATMVGTGIANRAIENRNNRMYSEAGRTFSETETVDDVIQTGLESAPETESYRLAQEIRAKREAGIEPTDAEIGKLHIENIRTINEEEANSEINAEETSEISVSEPFSHNDIREPLYNNGVNNVEFTNADRLLNELAIETQTAKLSEVENHFGENGKKAFRNYYQQENSVNDYYNGFSRFYEAGKVGLPFDKVNTVYSKGISPAVQYAAYAAGQNDEKVYLKRDKSASKVFYPKGNLVINEYSKKLSKAEADFYNRLSAITGNKIEFVGMDSIADGAADGSYSKGLINAEIGTEETRYVVISHEITHGLQRTSPQEYRAYRNYAVQLAEKSNGGNVSIVEQYSQLYKTDTENAMDEVAADFTKRIFKDKNEMERFINDNIHDNRSMLDKFFDTVKAFVDKIKNAFKGDKNAMDKAAVDEFGTTISELEEARRLWLKALKATDEKVKATQKQEWSDTKENNTVKYSLNPKFARQIDNWNGKSNTIFKVGTTSDALKSIGIKDKGIIWYGTKIAKILEKHHKITRDIIKQVPNILENPVLIMKSQKFGTRIVLMGELMDSDNNPIVAVLELQPTNKGGQVLDLNIIASAYVKDDNPIGFIKRSELLYIDENKERTEKWFNAVGLQLPSVAKPFGSIGKVTYNDGNVNIEGIPFREYMSDIKENTANANILQQRVNRSAAHNAAKRSSVSENNVAQYKTDVKFSLKRKKIDNGNEDTYNKYRWAMDNGLLSNAESAVFFENIGAIKRGEKFRKTYDGYYMIPTGENGINNTIVITDGNYIKPSIESVIKINIDNETELANVREDIYESKAGMHPSANKIVRGYEEEGISVEYKREDIWIYDGISSEVGRKNAENEGVYRNNSRQRNGRGSFGEDKNFSLKGDILKENAALKKYNEYLKAQMKLTKEYKVNSKQLDKLVKELIKENNSNIDKEELFNRLDGFYTYLQNSNELAWDDIKGKALDIAKDIIKESVIVNDEYYETYKDLKRFLKNTDITISEADRADFPDGYNNFRKANFGRLKLVNNGTNIDSIYQELDDMFPEYFDAEQYITAAEQAQNIVDVLDMLSEYEMQPDNYYVEQGAQFLADDIIERYFDIPQEKPTFADKKQNELIHQKIESGKKIRSMREQRDKDIKDNTLATQMHEGAKAAKTRRLKNEEIERIKQLSKERIKKLHKDKKTSIENLKNRQKEKETRMSDKRKRSILRNRIIRHINPMKTKLLKPSDNNHIPESMRTTVANILDAINLESKYSYDPLTGKRRNDNLGIPTKRTEEFLNLKELYQDILKSDSANEIIIDPSLLGDSGAGIESIIDEVIKMRNIRLDDMTLEQLNTVWDVLRAVEASITNAGKTLSSQKYKTTSAFAEAFVSDTSSRKNKKSYTRKHYSLDLETPYTFFSHYGQAGKDFYRMLRNAQDYEQTIQSELTSKMENVVSSEQRKKLEKEIIEFTTENGDNLILSKAHIMNIYLLSKRKQAEGHLYGSGIRQPEINRKIRRGTKDIRITQEDLNKLFSNLTSKEKSIADNMQKLTLFLAEKGNKTTMSVYGYEKFTDPNYWTIKSAKEGLQQNVEEGQDLARSIRNMGAAKATVPKASNTLEIGSVFEVFDNHASEMITYAAWLAPMEDANRLFNFSFRDEDGNKTGTTMKDLLNRIGGERSTDYWMNLMKDIQNGISMPADDAMSGIVNKAIGNVKKAAVASNIRVVVQQPTAYLRAAAVLSPENMIEGLVKGATKGNGWEKAVKYAPIAAIKKVGGFEVSSNPKQLSEILYSPETKKGKAIAFAKEFPTFGAGAADAVTWGAIWNACELQVEKTKTNLTVGSESFYKATAELFTEVIDQTQVVDGVLQRSQAMRSSNMYTKQATAFMGEPTLSLNLLMRTYDAWHNETIPKKRSAALKNMSRAAFALILSNVAVAIAQSAIDALRDDDEEKDYLERFLTALTGLTGDEKTKLQLAKNIALGGNIGNSMNVLTWIPYIKDIFSICQGYTIERMDASAFGDFISAAQNAIKSFSGEGTWTMGYAATKTVMTGAKLFGSSVSNLMRDIESILRSVLIETENWKELYNMEKGMYNLSTQTSRFFDILYQALESGDSSSYDYIAEDLIKNGIKPKSIESSMRAHRKNAENPKYKKEDMGAGIKLKFEEGEKKKEEKFDVDNLSSNQYIEYMHLREKILDDIISDYEAKGLGKMDAETANSLLDAAYEYANKVSLEEASDGKYEIDEKWIRDISNKSGSYSSVASQIMQRKKNK